MKKNNSKVKVLSLLLAVCLIMALSVTAFAATTNPAVTNDANGVLQVMVVYTDDNGKDYLIQSGSGFLINDTNLVTCNHVVVVDEDTLNEAVAMFGKSAQDVRQRLSIKVSVLRDVRVKATTLTQSDELDYAILTLASPIYDRTFLPIRSSAEVQATEDCYALGFPGESKAFQDVNTFTSDDVSIISGKVNKLTTVGGVDYIQSSVVLQPGNSGGPLVDDDGNVIGICQGTPKSEFEEHYYYAIASDQLTKVLKAMGVEYNEPGSPSPDNTPNVSAEPTESTEPVESADKSGLSSAISGAEALDSKLYDSASFAEVTSALAKAKDVMAKEDATQSEVDSALSALNGAMNDLKEAPSFPMWAIIAIAVGALAIIGAVIAIISKGKKKAPVAAAAVPPVPPVPPSGGARPAADFTPPAYKQGGAAPTGVLNQGSGETTVLNQGSGETTVLSKNQHFGILIRSKNNETIQISKPNFRIGKERAQVDYCISNNTAVSRLHASIINRNGGVYVADQRSTNGTFVNDVRLDSGKEVRLKSGDKITLGDEEFTFREN